MIQSMMIHNVTSAELSEKKVLDYGTGKCQMRDLRVTTDDGSTFVLSLFMEKIEEKVEA